MKKLFFQIIFPEIVFEKLRKKIRSDAIPHPARQCAVQVGAASAWFLFFIQVDNVLISFSIITKHESSLCFQTISAVYVEKSQWAE